MKALLVTVSGAALLAVAPAIAQTARTPAKAHHAAKVETRADAQSRVARHFARLDSNRDGFVTQAETDALLAKRAAKHAERIQKRAERRDPARIFERLDGNKDGQITQAEAEAARNARVAAKGKPARANAVAMGGLFGRADANKDGAITRAEFAAAPRPERKATRSPGQRRSFAGAMFGMADANKDGRVSLTEAQQAALQHFDRADANRDGQLTPEERRAARQQMRGQRHKG